MCAGRFNDVEIIAKWNKSINVAWEKRLFVLFDGVDIKAASELPVVDTDILY